MTKQMHDRCDCRRCPLASCVHPCAHNAASRLSPGHVSSCTVLDSIRGRLYGHQGTSLDTQNTPASDEALARTRPSTLHFPVVGIGASAGGIAATVRLLQQVLPDSGMAYVVVFHLSADHESHAPEILQRATAMPVIQVRETVAIKPDHVYVIAPGLQLAMDDGHLVVIPGRKRNGPPVTIDLFFRTLARAHRERAVAVVLSGSGSDGAVGLSEVKLEGGVAMVQTPSDAEHASMPNAAVETGLADFVLDADEMGAKLSALWENARSIALPDASEMASPPKADASRADEDAEHAIHDILAVLLSRTANDFRHYKRGTMLRRLARRMQVTRQPNLPAYRDYLVEHPQEAAPLLQDMLISVTSFFRDHEAFTALERDHVAQLLDRRPAQTQLRAWVVGCATGEEAYSIAMVLNDRVPAKPRVAIQLFASDIDERALARARTGQYPAAAGSDIAPARLRSYFDEADGVLRVKKAVREQILFARHNVLRDAPFSRVDLITCRNLLIYLDRAVQVEVLKVFHFALNPGGLLFLGSAETAEAAPEHFTSVDKKHRIYRANPMPAQRRELLPLRMASLPTLSPPEVPVHASPLADLHHRFMAAHSAVSILTDLQFNILHTSEGAGRYLRYAEGRPSQDLLQTILPELASALRPALLQAARDSIRVAARSVAIPGEQGPIVVRMTVHGGSTATPSGQLLVCIEDVQVDLNAQVTVASDGFDPVVSILEAELQRLRDRLQGTLGDSALSDEALRASNEELQSMNEEMRSTTEELETSKEELQSVNEELSTVNFELKHKVEEADRVNDDLSNLITSMNIATLFVDRDLHIKGFTPLASNVFNVLSSDVGRPLLDLTHRLRHEGLAQDVHRVVATLASVEREVASADGRWYLMRVSPYRANGDRIDGAVLNFIDITERRNAQEALRVRDERLRMVAESTRDYAMITMDGSGAITGWNRGAQLMFGYAESEVTGQHFRMLFVPEDRAAGQAEEELRLAQAHGRALDERFHLRKDGSRFYCSGITSTFVEGGTPAFAKIARDLTERQRLEKQQADLLLAEQQVRKRLEVASAARSEFLAVMSHELKTPLNLIMLSAEMLGGAQAVRSVPHLARAAETIKHTVRGQGRIIDDLLDLSRLTTGKLTLQPAAVSLRPVMDRIVEALQGPAHKKEIALQASGDDLMVDADVVRLEQIIWNLANNAVKFTPQGGSVTLELHREAEWACIAVQDSGRGVAPEFLPQLFDMFSQEDSGSSTRKDGGLGIGLALVKSLALLHGGRVSATSDGRGHGARFEVRLPLKRGLDQAPERHAQTDMPSLAGIRVLLVDDDADSLELMELLLSERGFVATTALNADQALARAATGTFDVLISDIALPEMDGRALLRSLKKLPGLASAVTIAVSGFGRQEDQKLSLDAGFDLHLNKPLAIETLEAEVKRLILKSR